MRAGFKVTFETGARTITVTLPDYFAWAKWSGKPIEQAEGSVEDMVRLIHIADVRTGGTERDFDDWAAQIVDIDRLEVVAPKAIRKAPGNASGAKSKRT